ncbi:MAG: NHLP family bacteriocin export ABC transporter peptidase/permease/ATPase subunit [Acidobacteriota bacterium]|nr:NHLP family bacteriocin export ABC transporter peptidase/permease/ATPase subunit [Acidobacteriota bacterium]
MNQDQKMPPAARVRTPTVIQMEAVECGAASLGMVLGHYGRYEPLEELRIACGVSRDGSNVIHILQAAQNYGLEAQAYQVDPTQLAGHVMPVILFWNFNHFVVLEGADKDKVYINDPASGPRAISHQELSQAFTGVALTLRPGPDFKRSGQRPSILRSLRPRLTGAAPALTMVILAGLGLTLPGLALPFFTKVFVDEVLIRGLDTWLWPLCIGMGFTALIRAALSWLQGYYLLKLELKMALVESGRFFWHVLQLPMDFFLQRMAGDIAGRVDINDRTAHLLSGKLANAVIELITAVFFVVVMFFYDPLLTAVGLLVALANLAFLQLVSKKRITENIKLNQERGKLMGAGTHGLKVIETLKATGAESDFFAKWAGYQAKALNSSQNLGRLTFSLLVVPPLLSALNTVVILYVGGLRVMDGHMTMGMLVAFQSLMASLMAPVNNLVMMGADIQNAGSDMNRLDDILRHNADIRPPERPQGDGAPVKLSGGMELRNLTFGYCKLDPPLIVDFNLKLEPGSRVALVGKSGSGKSTIAKLAAGLYHPWQGEILFDGRPWQQHPRLVLNNSIAVVDQDVVLFEGNIRENLTLWDTTIPEQDVIGAAIDAHIHDEITGRPGGYHASVREGGANFSGGQRQRLEIARALVENPSILILDEATSALDPETERIVEKNLRGRGCACLVVAHRLSTIRDCDEIIVMDHGRIVERGTHESLCDAGGAYAELVRSF